MPCNAPFKKADIKGHNNVICNNLYPIKFIMQIYGPAISYFLFARLQINRCGGVKKAMSGCHGLLGTFEDRWQ